jgi:hypothetical protein
VDIKSQDDNLTRLKELRRRNISVFSVAHVKYVFIVVFMLIYIVFRTLGLNR